MWDEEGTLKGRFCSDDVISPPPRGDYFLFVNNYEVQVGYPVFYLLYRINNSTTLYDVGSSRFVVFVVRL